MGSGSKIKLFIGEDEVSDEEYAAYVTELFKLSVADSTKADEVRSIERVLSLITDFHKHKYKQPLIDGVRKNPELFQSRVFREFVADLLSGDYRPMVAGVVTKERIARHLRIRATVDYYKNMGIPVYYEGNRVDRTNCVLLTAKRLEINEETVKDALKDRRKKEVDQFSRSIIVSRDIDSHDGFSIFVLNGFRAPQTEAEIAELEEIYLSINAEDRRKIARFSYLRTPKNSPSPKTQSELKRINNKLSKQVGYSIVRLYQKQSLSLNQG